MLDYPRSYFLAQLHGSLDRSNRKGNQAAIIYIEQELIGTGDDLSCKVVGSCYIDYQNDTMSKVINKLLHFYGYLNLKHSLFDTKHFYQLKLNASGYFLASHT